MIKWISLNELKPPIGMYVLLNNGRSEICMVEWSKYLNDEENQCDFIDSFSDTWCGPREIYDFNWWIPLSFLNPILPTGEDLEESEDWLLHHKENKKIEEIKKLTHELLNLTPEEAEKRNTSYSDHITTEQSYKCYLLDRIRKKYFEVQHDIDSYDEAHKIKIMPFDKDLLNVEMPNFIKNLPDDCESLFPITIKMKKMNEK